MSTVSKWFLWLPVLGVTSMAAMADVSLQDRQQAACYHDAQTLCGEFIPDAQKTETCMGTMKDRVSARCRAFYPD